MRIVVWNMSYWQKSENERAEAWAWLRDSGTDVALVQEAVPPAGRAQRTALTREMWESLNDAWLHFSAIKPRDMTSDQLPEFLDWVRSRSARSTVARQRDGTT